MFSIMVSSVDDEELVEVIVANQQNASGIILAESDPLYEQIINAADAVMRRSTGDALSI